MTIRSAVRLLPLLLVVALGACDERAPLDPASGDSPADVPTGDGGIRGGISGAERVRDFLGGEGEGVDAVVAGVGLFAQPATLDAHLPVIDVGDVLEAHLYWSGRSLTAEGDDTILVSGVEVTGSELAAFEHSVSPKRWAFVYRADVSGLVEPGANSLELSGFDLGPMGRPDGAALVVVHRAEGGFAAVHTLELADFFYWADVEALHGEVHSFAFDPADEARPAALTLVVADGEAERPDALWWTAGAGPAPADDLIGVATSIPDVLVSGAGAEMDVVAIDDLELEAGTEHLAFQFESPAAGDGDSGLLSLAVLRLGAVEDPGDVDPECDAGGPYAGVVGEAVEFDATGTVDPDGRVVGYEWDFGDGGGGTGANPVHAYAEPGTYDVTLCLVLDDDEDLRGEEDPICCTTTVTIEAAENAVPVCLIGDVFDGEIYVGQEISFEGGDSFDPDGTVVSLAWDFGDGATAEGADVAHAWTEPGTYLVELCVTDDDDATSCCSVEVIILESPGEGRGRR